MSNPSKTSAKVSTKDEIIQIASKMLLMKGLSGFSLQELAAELDIKKASLFHHYPSKNALAVELYRFYQNAFMIWSGKYGHLKPEQQILKYAESLTNWICVKGRVCPVGAMSLEWSLIDPKLRVEIKKLHTIQRDWLTKLFKQIQKEQGLSLSLNEAVLGTMGLLQGSIQLARINEDPTLLVKNLKCYLKNVIRQH